MKIQRPLHCRLLALHHAAATVSKFQQRCHSQIEKDFNLVIYFKIATSSRGL
jgi:hypothetical protein